MDFFPETFFGWCVAFATLTAPVIGFYQYANIIKNFTPKYKCYFNYNKEKHKQIIAEIFLERMNIPYYIK